MKKENLQARDLAERYKNFERIAQASMLAGAIVFTPSSVDIYTGNPLPRMSASESHHTTLSSNEIKMRNQIYKTLDYSPHYQNALHQELAEPSLDEKISIALENPKARLMLGSLFFLTASLTALTIAGRRVDSENRHHYSKIGAPLLTSTSIALGIFDSFKTIDRNIPVDIYLFATALGAYYVNHYLTAREKIPSRRIAAKTAAAALLSTGVVLLLAANDKI